MIEHFSHENRSYPTGVDHLKSVSLELGGMIDSLAQEEVALVQKLERISSTRIYLIKEHSRLTERIKDHEGETKQSIPAR